MLSVVSCKLPFRTPGASVPSSVNPKVVGPAAAVSLTPASSTPPHPTLAFNRSKASGLGTRLPFLTQRQYFDSPFPLACSAVGCTLCVGTRKPMSLGISLLAFYPSYPALPSLPHHTTPPPSFCLSGDEVRDEDSARRDYPPPMFLARECTSCGIPAFETPNLLPSVHTPFSPPPQKSVR